MEQIEVRDDLKAAYTLIMLRLEERIEKGPQNYYEEFYGLDYDVWNEVFDFFINDAEAITRNCGFDLFVLAYEIGRTHAEYIKDVEKIS